MLKILIIFIILFNLKVFCENLNKPPVIAQTSYGTTEGFIHKIESGQLIDVFLGIPFAEKPVGLLRLEVFYKIKIFKFYTKYFIFKDP